MSAVSAVSRRNVLGVGFGAAVAAATPGVAHGASAGVQLAAASRAAWQPRFFTAAQGKTLAVLCDLILPQTSTPSATAAGVHLYIDEALSVAPSDEQLEFLGGLGWLQVQAQERFAAPFAELDEARQIALLEEISDAQEADLDSEVPGASQLAAGRAFFADLKARVLFGYYTSKTGRVEALGLPDSTKREQWTGCEHDGHG